MIHFRSSFVVAYFTCLILFYPSFVLSTSYAAEQPDYSIEEIKAGYIYNFVSFIQWPDSVFSTKNSPIKIEVLGDNDFSKILKSVLKGNKTGGRSLTVTGSKQLSSDNSFQILYIGKRQVGKVEELIKAVGESPVLTVGHSPELAAKGIVINFFKKGNRLRFEINLDAAKRANLKISSRLLHIATIVEDAAKEKE